jgi:hypothetical protein
MTVPDGEDYYEILQVSPRAEPEVIHAAYLRLAKKYHPDINRDPQAAQRMKQINAAYEVLGDPSRRKDYDAKSSTRYRGSARGSGTAAPAPAPAEEAAEQVFPGCQVCGRIDATVRFSVFLWTASLVLVSWRRAAAGIWCRHHREIEAAKWTGLSLLVGPWGIPFGLFWTAQALITNGLGGRQPSDVNAALLRGVARHLIGRGDYPEAAEALASSLRLEYDQAAAEVLGALLHDYPAAEPRVRKAAGTRAAFSLPYAASIVGGAIPAAAVISLLIFSYAGGESSASVPSAPHRVSVITPVATRSTGPTPSNVISQPVTPTPSDTLQVVVCEGKTVTIYPWETEKSAVLDHYNFVTEYNNRMVDASTVFQRATAAITNYDDAISSPQFVQAADTYISALEAGLAPLRGKQSVPEKARAFDSAMRQSWETELAVVQKFRDATALQSPSLWNEGVDLAQQGQTYDSTSEQETRAICSYLAD